MLLATVDEIEEGIASLLLRRGDDEVPLGDFAVSDLPFGVKPGDILTLSFTMNEEETKAARERIFRIHELLKKKNQR